MAEPLMPLVLENVPANLVRQIEELAALERIPLAVELIRLLEEAVRRKRSLAPASAPPAPPRPVRDILDDLARSRFRPDPTGPSVVDLSAEDRQR